MKRNFEKGITLIALVITIIVLIILAGVSINLLFNQDGIIQKAKRAAQIANQEKYYEEIELEITSLRIDYGTSTIEKSFSEVLLNALEKKNWINSIDVENLEEGKAVITIETTDGYEIKINVDNNTCSATIDKDSYKKINYDAIITYEANGGTGSMEIQLARTGYYKKLKDCGFKRDKYAFLGWSTSQNGSIIEENKLEITGNITLYAQWAESYKLTFDSNGGVGEMNDLEVVKGSTITLPTNRFTNENYVFNGWKVDSTTYTDGQEITVNKDMTLIAQWVEGYIITLNANNGTGMVNKLCVAKGKSITLPNNIYTNGNLSFYRWNTEEDESGIQYRNKETITPTQDMNLYVQWVEAIAGNDLLSIVKNNNFENNKVYYATVNNEIYGMHVYNIDSTTISTSVEYGDINDVATSSSPEAKNMVVLKVNGDLTITSQGKLTAYADPNGYGGPKGMLVYCTGTLKNSGNISMTARGARAKGEDVYLWKNQDGSYEYVPAMENNSTSVKAGKGGNGTNRGLGGGGAGGCRYNIKPSVRSGNSTSYSGGAGMSGLETWSKYSYSAGSDNGGSGGSTQDYISGGGAGNPGGIGVISSNGNATRKQWNRRTFDYIC